MIKKLKLQFLKNSIYLYLAQGINLLFPLIIIPLLIKRLTVEGFGLIVLVQIIMGYGSTLVDYGFNMIGVRDVGTAKNIKRIGEILGEALIVKVILVFLSLSLVLITGFFIQNLIGEWKLIMVGWLAVLGYAFYPIWYFQGAEKMYMISFNNIFSKTLIFGLIIYFIKDSSQVHLALLFLSLGPIINALLSWVQILFFYKVTLFLPSKIRIFQVFHEGKDILFSNFIVQIYSNFTVVISSSVLTITQIGILGVFIKLRDVANSVVGPIQQAIFPELSRLAKKTNYLMIYTLTKKTIFVLMGMMALMSIGILYFHELLNEVLFSNKTTFNDFFIFIFILLVLPFGGIYTKILVVFEKMKWIRITTLISGVLTIVFAYPIMIWLGLKGALLVIGLSFGINGIVGWFYTRKILIQRITKNI